MKPTPDPIQPIDPEIRLTALLLGELSPMEAEATQAAIAADPDLAKLYGELERTVGLLKQALAPAAAAASNPPTPATMPRLSEDRRQRLLARFMAAPAQPQKTSIRWRGPVFRIAALFCLLGTIGYVVSFMFRPAFKLSSIETLGARPSPAPASIAERNVDFVSRQSQERYQVEPGARRGRLLSAADGSDAAAAGAGGFGGGAGFGESSDLKANGRVDAGRLAGRRGVEIVLPTGVAAEAEIAPQNKAVTRPNFAFSPPPAAQSLARSEGLEPLAINLPTPAFVGTPTDLPLVAKLADSMPSVAATTAGESGTPQSAGAVGKVPVIGDWPAAGRYFFDSAKGNWEAAADARPAPDPVAGPGANRERLLRQRYGLPAPATRVDAPPTPGLVVAQSPAAADPREWSFQGESRSIQLVQTVDAEQALAEALASAVEDRTATTRKSLSRAPQPEAASIATNRADDGIPVALGFRGFPESSRTAGPVGIESVTEVRAETKVALTDLAAAADKDGSLTRSLRESLGEEVRFGSALAMRPIPTDELVPTPADRPVPAAAPSAAFDPYFVQTEFEKVRSKVVRDQTVDELGLVEDKLAERAELPALRKLERDPEAPPARPASAPPIPQPDTPTAENPFSTFSLNVADVSFKLAAASLEQGQMPAPASIRSEEFVNAFDYRDPLPRGDAPVAFAWERARYPFAHNRDIVRFAVKTAALGREAARPLNLVLCVDNSGSMERADRVGILREALHALGTQLKAGDTVSAVVFARTPTLCVDGLPGERAAELVDSIGSLTPQGGTDLGEALRSAYATAARHYLEDGVNRVVLLTDGAANLGEVEPESLKQMVEEQRRQGIALDCFGIGWEGYNDDLLEVLSRNGDGRYGFVNSPEEAATEFVGRLAGALQVAASDVKVQVEFNPARVTSYRQIGYAKHQLTKEQFRDNTVDAAEIGAAEAGNALYVLEVNEQGAGPLAVVRVRHKVPATGVYEEREWTVAYTGPAPALDAAAPTLRLAASASAFSEWLGSSPFAQEVTPDALLQLLRGVPEVFGADSRPKRLQWMIQTAQSIAGR